MRTWIVVILLAVFFVAPVVQADWTESKNGKLFQRLQYLAERMQVLRTECLVLELIWSAESVSSDPSFVSVDGITTGEATALITYCQAVRAFHENEAVATANREVNLAPFLANVNP